jgi:sulfoxide reductase catalytic subunit YedY
MLIRTPKRGDVRPSEVTPRPLYLDRRRFIAASGLALVGAAAGVGMLGSRPASASPRQRLDGVVKGADRIEEPLTAYEDVTRYNNFYELGTEKGDPVKHAGSLRTRPWTVAVAGHCERPGTYDVDDLVRPHRLEERVYRLRCVEAWSMVVPWVGVPLGDVLKRFGPTSQAKYVAFTTLLDPEQLPGQRRPVLDWPYVEGLRIDEAMHPLTLLAVGLYGEVLPGQNGAPIRLVVPWKYGFKSIKSIVRIELTEREPPTSWNRQAPGEYGFYANVNPEVDHPRWSQKKERRIGEGLFAPKRPTLMFNGYAGEVAGLYAGMDLRKHY